MRRGGIAAKTKIRRTASTHQGPSEWRVQVGQRVSDPNELGPECFCDGLKPVEQASPQNVWLSMSQRFGCRTDWPRPLGRLDVAINVGRAQADVRARPARSARAARSVQRLDLLAPSATDRRGSVQEEGHIAADLRRHRVKPAAGIPRSQIRSSATRVAAASLEPPASPA